MKYLIVILIPPLYFVLERKWLAFVGNSALYALAWLTVFAFGIGVLFWALAVTHAGWHLRKELIQEQAETIAREINRQSQLSDRDFT